MFGNGGRRARTVAILVWVVAVVGGLFAERAIARAGQRGAGCGRRTQPTAGPGTPCSASARSCVDLESQRAWLINNGKVVRGPVKISSGGAGKETPLGHSFRVYRKEQDHESNEFRLANGRPAPMPWSVFFADGGIAFHGGNPARASSGCIHLAEADTKARSSSCRSATRSRW